MRNRLLIEIIFFAILFSFVSIGVSPYHPPTISNEYPTDDSTNIYVSQSTVNVTIGHLNHLFNWTIEGTYITNTGANYESNGSKSANTITPLPLNICIMWYLNLSDCNDTSAFPDYNLTYNFTTTTGQRLTHHFTDPSKILLIGLVTLFLLLGLIVYTIKSIKEKSFKFENFITLFFTVVVITVLLSFI